MIDKAIEVFEETILSILPPCCAACSHECGGWMSDEDKTSVIQEFKESLSKNSILSSLEELPEKLVQAARHVLQAVKNFHSDHVEYWTHLFSQKFSIFLKPTLATHAA